MSQSVGDEIMWNYSFILTI